MGLDIAVAPGAYENYVGDEQTDERWEREDLIFVHNLNGFKDRQDGMMEGFYKTTGITHKLHLSYGSYGHLREWIAERCLGMTLKQIWKDPCGAEVSIRKETGEKAVGLVKLLNYADNEGTIGPLTSAMIARALVDRRESILGEDEWLCESYEALIEAFEGAADSNGFVVFC